ncbi:hypothetical protein HanPSC8_Chr17g0778141 [Helianthus annuus]|nr:hypothetical protein HanPSC8_Chr17g0778141 [Helianthus annuus]
METDHGSKSIGITGEGREVLSGTLTALTMHAMASNVISLVLIHGMRAQGMS